MSMVDLPALNPHWDSGYTRAANTFSRAKMTLANTGHTKEIILIILELQNKDN